LLFCLDKQACRRRSGGAADSLGEAKCGIPAWSGDLDVANKEHVERLKQGVEVWNRWRGEGTRPDPDLSGTDLFGANLSAADLNGADLLAAHLDNADLSGATLSGANLDGAHLPGAKLLGAKLLRAKLFGAYLYDADLSGADLNGADLTRADLRNANLSGTDMRDAKLTGTNLEGADMRDANLSGTFLLGAILIGAGLSRANLTDAKIGETVFANINLTSVIGLATCKHYGPSTIDHRTLQKSGSLPIPFLRGIGLPDNVIEYLPSLFNKAIQYYSCFISYSTVDDEFAKRIHADLENNGVRCWFAPHDLPIGEKILDSIVEAIRLRDKVLLILSEHSIQSEWVEDEVTKGFEEERKRGQIVLFPVRLDNAVMTTTEAWAAKLRERHIGDFLRWKDHNAYKQSFERVLRDLKHPTKVKGDPI
jgi:uncharacterized protein YjbI with pentapeptide repeats